MSEQAHIVSIIQESIRIKSKIIDSEQLMHTIEALSDVLVECLKSGGKVLFCGNGGSAADAQHLAAELSGRFYLERAPLFAEALHVNSSFLTAVANDYGYEEVFARMVRAKGRAGDVLIGISTSGNSVNILNAIKQANEQGLVTVSMTGEAGGLIAQISDYQINIPSSDTPRVQECHILVGHIICEIVERKMAALS